MKMSAILNGLKIKNKDYYKDNDDNLILKDGTVISYTSEENDGPNDCYNYCDWSALEDTGFFDEDINHNNLKLESCEYGIRINGYFVPCYSCQNGYYTSMITVSAKYNNEIIATTETECDY